MDFIFCIIINLIVEIIVCGFFLLKLSVLYVVLVFWYMWYIFIWIVVKVICYVVEFLLDSNKFKFNVI